MLNSAQSTIHENMVITAIGMSSSLGAAIPACAAARAGMMRLTPSTHMVADSEEGGANPTPIHQCPGADGFQGVMRLAFLMSQAIDDLLSHTLMPISHIYSESACFFNLPNPENDPCLEYDLELEDAQDIEAPFVTALRRMRPPPFFSSGNIYCDQGGHAGVLTALGKACALIKSGNKKYCLVGGVDSKTDHRTLEYLFEEGYLKHSGNSNGFIPGEGAALFLVEHEETALEHGIRVLARIGPMSSGSESYAYSDPDIVQTGHALTKNILGILDAAKDFPKPDLCYNDLNGSELRAREWGYALVKCLPKHPFLDELELEIPATSFGELGAATGAFALCLAASAFKKPAQSILICNASEEGARAGVLISNRE